MVQMAMGHQDMGNPLAFEIFKKRMDMVRIVRTWINNSDFAFADDVGPGPVEGEGAGVTGGQPADARPDAFQDPVLKWVFLAKSDSRHLLN